MLHIWIYTSFLCSYYNFIYLLTNCDLLHVLWALFSASNTTVFLKNIKICILKKKRGFQKMNRVEPRKYTTNVPTCGNCLFRNMTITSSAQFFYLYVSLKKIIMSIMLYIYLISIQMDEKENFANCRTNEFK